MEFFTRMFVKAREWRKGQTTNEYIMILAGVAVAVEAFVTYEVMAHPINPRSCQSVDNLLPIAARRQPCKTEALQFPGEEKGAMKKA
jgi:hypothetical protein